MASAGTEDAIRQAIARQEALLEQIDKARNAATSELAKLRAELESIECRPLVNTAERVGGDEGVPMTASQKVALFRSLFRGREDVYPKLWANAKTGRQGYAPACANEWIRGVCEKPRVKCGECPNQAFFSVSDQAVLDHLQGRHVLGVYPLLEDETCWLLAVDFDKKFWRADVAAFADTCRTIGLPTAVERSRSGEGAHV